MSLANGGLRDACLETSMKKTKVYTGVSISTEVEIIALKLNAHQ